MELRVTVVAQDIALGYLGKDRRLAHAARVMIAYCKLLLRWVTVMER
jgi:hypothetical protein